MKNTPIIIGIVLILLAAIGGYFFMQTKAGIQMMGLNKDRLLAENGGSNMTSLKDLMNLGQSQVCTFSSTTETGSVEGTSYVAGGKVRTDFNGTDQTDASYQGGMIMDSEYVYSWTSQMEQGIKMPISAIDSSMPEQTAEQSDQPYQKPAVDPNEQVEYSCSNWNVDNSVFMPPSNITFMDMSEQIEMMQQIMPTGAETMETNTDMQNACSACDSLTGDAQAACKQALSCP